MTGLWVVWLGRRLPAASWPVPRRPRLNRVAAAIIGLLCVAAAVLFFSGWEPGTYLALEVGWLLLPVIPQMLVGADVLWHQRRLVLLGVLVPWLYLTAADFVAIGAGTWTIAPDQSTGILLGGILPIEEAIFFLLTNMLIVFGTVLFLGTDNAPVKKLIDRYLQSRTEVKEVAHER
jgi:lycopene cyclase domain-containing protein